MDLHLEMDTIFTFPTMPRPTQSLTRNLEPSTVYQLAKATRAHSLEHSWQEATIIFNPTKLKCIMKQK